MNLTEPNKNVNIEIKGERNYMWTPDKESLCNSHNNIQYWAKDIKRKLKKSIKKDNMTILTDIIPIVDDIIKESREAKKKGQKMENRLKKYYDSIVSWGFERVGRK
jgi:molecular chaperone GrpE (heat shock protein)